MTETGMIQPPRGACGSRDALTIPQTRWVSRSSARLPLIPAGISPCWTLTSSAPLAAATCSTAESGAIPASGVCWHGYFHHYLTTVDGDWAAAICDNCYADLRPAIAVTVRFYAARVPRFLPGGAEAVAAIRQRTRSDHDYPDIGHFPDIGQQMTWRLRWEHTAMLVDDARGNCSYDLDEISRDEAGQIAAGLAARHWPPDVARLPWVTSAYPR